MNGKVSLNLFMEKTLIDHAYQIAKTEYKSKPFSFSAIWKAVLKKCNLTESQNSENVGDFFSDMLEDVRFVYLPNEKWTLREYMNYNDWEVFSHSLFGNKNLTEEIVDDMIKKEKTDEIEEDMIIMDSELNDDDENNGDDIAYPISNDSDVSETEMVENFLDDEEEQ